jgi:formylmethanofuran dehydrogenase subunit D
MNKLKFTLITGRTIEQGCSKELGKLTKSYFENISICEINYEDMLKLGIKEGDKIKLTSNSSSVVFRCKKSKRQMPSKTVFVPYGLWSNILVNSCTEGVGMPLYKGLTVRIEPTKDKILDLKALLSSFYR